MELEINSESQGGHIWTDAQLQVIEADPRLRMLIDAGPGTGKTATACARVAWLIEESGIEPHQILMTSFTNTAVFEIRNRIKSFLRDPEKAVGIKISTLDSFAWNLRAGFHDGEIGFTSYDESIEKAVQLISVDANVKEFLLTVEHFIVDEAQDITGPRSSLVQKVIRNLSDTSGVSVFSDDAQAIYGFSEEDSPEYFGATLPQEIRENEQYKFKIFDLSEIHRTSDENLKGLFSQGRNFLLKEKANEANSVYDEVRDLILRSHHNQVGTSYEMLLESYDEKQLSSNPFLLFRRRADALQASHYLGTTSRRLRLSGYPMPVLPWIARCFWDHVTDRLTESEFIDLAKKRLKEDDIAIAQKWDLLHREVGVDKNRISIKKLSNLLSRPNVPNSFCLQDYGLNGPIIGTVHAAKGRESEEVVFFMPHTPYFRKVDEDKTDEKLLEEARILFVGATRARNTLVVSDRKGVSHFKKMITHYRSQRAFTLKNSENKQVAVEIGKQGDVAPEGLAGRNFFADEAEVILAQKALWDRRDFTFPLRGESSANSKWHYALRIDYEYDDDRYSDPMPDKKFSDTLLFLSQNLNRDLFWVGEKVYKEKNLKPPQKIRYLYSLGTRTLALSSTDPQRELLHEPWKSSGLMLAPILIGYPDVYLKGYGRRFNVSN